MLSTAKSIEKRQVLARFLAQSTIIMRALLQRCANEVKNKNIYVNCKARKTNYKYNQQLYGPTY